MKKTSLLAAVLVALAGMAHAAELILYKQPEFRGASQSIKGEVNNLEGGFAREAESAIVKGGHWEVCTDDHFKGRCYVLAPGEYPRLGELERRIVSTRFVGNDAGRIARLERFEARQERREERREERWRDRYAGAIDLYGQPGFRGRSVRVDRSVHDLSEARFDGRASSAVVHEGRWQLCSEPAFEGLCRVYGPGEYPRLAELDDRVSSVRRVR